MTAAAPAPRSARLRAAAPAGAGDGGSRPRQLLPQGVAAETGQAPAANVAVTDFATSIVTAHWLALP